MTTPLRFSMEGRVTGIGSLPFADPDAAVRFVAERSPEIPFWPQLPRRSGKEGMIAQAIGSGLEGPEPELDRDHAAGFFAFEEAFRAGAFPRAVAVKGQIAGPITLASGPFPGGSSSSTAASGLKLLTDRVAALARWQIARLKRFGLPVLLFIDEPSLGQLPPTDLAEPGGAWQAALSRVVRAVRDAGASAGLHCCAEIPPSLVKQVSPDIFSFDAHSGLDTFFRSEGGRAYLKSGGALALGLIPTRGPLDASSPLAILDAWRRAAGPCGDLRDLARRSLVTAACGLGTLDEAAASASFDAAHELSRRFRDLAAGLDGSRTSGTS